MDLGPHAGFIIASYLLCLVTVLGLIVWVLVDRRTQNRALEELAGQGISRTQVNAPSKGSE